MPEPHTDGPAAMNLPAGTEPAKREIKLISHSTLFYWWPVWAFGFFLAIWTFVETDRLVIAPASGKVDVLQTKESTSYNLRFDSRAKFDPENEQVKSPDKDVKDVFPARVSRHAWLGSMFIVVLLLTIFITNVPLRGLWSFLTIMGIVVIALLFSVFHVWDDFYTITRRFARAAHQHGRVRVHRLGHPHHLDCGGLHL